MFDLALDCMFQSLNTLWYSTPEVTLYGHQITQSHVGYKFCYIDTGLKGYVVSHRYHMPWANNEVAVMVNNKLYPISRTFQYLLKL